MYILPAVYLRVGDIIFWLGGGIYTSYCLPKGRKDNILVKRRYILPTVYLRVGEIIFWLGGGIYFLLFT